MRAIIASNIHEVRADRYMAINRWLKRRYAEGGWIVTQIGPNLTRYEVLDRAFFRRYLFQHGTDA